MERHPADLVSLVFGLLFAAAGAVFLVQDAPLLALQLRWVAPLAVLLAGVWLLVSVVLRRPAQAAPEYDDVQGDEPEA